MGRNKEYRQRLRYQVESALKKTFANQTKNELMESLGLCEGEAELIAKRLSTWFLAQPGIRGPNQILVLGAHSRESFSRGKASLNGKHVKVTPFDAYDLDVELEYGLKEMQLGRMLRIIEEAYFQDSLVDLKQISFICNITPTSVRSRLKAVRSKGVWVPIRGLSTHDREQGGVFRSTYLLKAYLEGENLGPLRQELGMPRTGFPSILSSFAVVLHDVFSGKDPLGVEAKEWARMASGVPESKLKPLLDGFSPVGQAKDVDDMLKELQLDFNLSPFKVRAIRELVSELSQPMLPQSRKEGEVIYYAVEASEPAGKPLHACKLVSAKICLLAPEEWPTEENQDLNRLSEIKYNRILRYATETKRAGGYLTYADLSFLMGIHSEAIRGLVGKTVHFVPLRGAACDIRRGMTHKREIVELYLQMHTETEIVSRTGHSYASIENYIVEFGRIWLLHQRGLPAPMIRRVTRRSMQLVNTYLELIKEYDTPAYAFRFHHLQNLVGREDTRLKEGDPKT